MAENGQERMVETEMERSQWYVGATNGVVLCVDQAIEHQFSGRFYHSYSREGTIFSNMDQALFELEQFYDSLNFPHATTNDRSFGEEKRKMENGRQERKKEMKDEELLSRHGDLGTFIIRVQHRQNSSWQGRITWMDKNKTVYFRSIWEMIKLVAGALDTVSCQEEEQEASWEDEQ